MADAPEQASTSAVNTESSRRLRAVLRAPMRSLPSRIILSVFGAALVTSLAVALVSTSSIESFLRRKIDQKFPATLSSASERLDLWYAQRRLDIETFARSTTVIENAAHMNLAEGALKRGRATETLGQYLDYVLYCLQIMSDDLATLHYRTKGGQKAPVIVRTRGHRLEGIWHSGSLMAGIIHLLRGMYVLVPRDMTQAAGFSIWMRRRWPRMSSAPTSCWPPRGSWTSRLR